MGLLRDPEAEGCGALGEPDEGKTAADREGVEQAAEGAKRERQRADGRHHEQVGERAEERQRTEVPEHHRRRRQRRSDRGPKRLDHLLPAPAEPADRPRGLVVHLALMCGGCSEGAPMGEQRPGRSHRELKAYIGHPDWLPGQHQRHRAPESAKPRGRPLERMRQHHDHRHNARPNSARRRPRQDHVGAHHRRCREERCPLRTEPETERRNPAEEAFEHKDDAEAEQGEVHAADREHMCDPACRELLIHERVELLAAAGDHREQDTRCRPRGLREDGALHAEAEQVDASAEPGVGTKPDGGSLGPECPGEPARTGE